MLKNSKTIIVICISFLILAGCQEKENNRSKSEGNLKTTMRYFNTVIALEDQGSFTLVENIGDKISDWQDLINSQTSLNINFDEYSVDYVDANYYLTGKDTNQHFTSRIRLILDSGNLYEREYPDNPSAPGYGGTCTCTGCKATGPEHSGECSPKENAGGWYCTDCSDGDCVKTETAGGGGSIL